MAVTNAVTDNAEHRRYQRTDIAERGEQSEQQHRPGLDQHVPAENERLHLERPRGEQIGRPLKAVVPDAEWCERGRRRRVAQDALSRFIAVHPALFLVMQNWIASRARRFKQPTSSSRLQAADIALPRCESNSRLTSTADIAGLNR